MTELPVTLGWLEDTFLPTRIDDQDERFTADWWFGGTNVCQLASTGRWVVWDKNGALITEDQSRDTYLLLLKDYLKPNASIHPSSSPMSSLFWSGVYDCSQHYYQGIACIEACDGADGTT